MPLPTSYLTSAKNLSEILDAIKGAKAPEKFTTRFLESLEFKSAADRLIIGVLKALRFLDVDGKPIDRYFEFLDQTRSERVLAEGIREAYADLFQVNINAHNLLKSDVVNKFKTLSQGQLTDNVADKMAMTFVSLAKLADFQSIQKPLKEDLSDNKDRNLEYSEDEDKQKRLEHKKNRIRETSLMYNIQIILPESRDQKVYDLLFRSLKEHLDI